MKTLNTPKLDKLIAKAEKAGLKVEVTVELGAPGAPCQGTKTASIVENGYHRCLGTSSLFGSIECYNRNSKCKI
jgi:hypothetical protein